MKWTFLGTTFRARLGEVFAYGRLRIHSFGLQLSQSVSLHSRRLGDTGRAVLGNARGERTSHEPAVPSRGRLAPSTRPILLKHLLCRLTGGGVLLGGGHPREVSASERLRIQFFMWFGLQLSVHIAEVFAYGRCPLAEDRL